MVIQDLWHNNHPKIFWQFQTEYSEEIWDEAIQAALPILEIDFEPGNELSFLADTLGEKQFGSKRYQLSISKRLYYLVKPYLPRLLINQMKNASARTAKNDFRLHWPIEDRFVRFQWEIARQLLNHTDQQQITMRNFWPRDKNFAVVLTHDIESSDGQSFVRDVADLEEQLDFRSSFNFVPERYKLDHQLMNELCERGFEVGIHGLRHDGNLFKSEKIFNTRSSAINSYLQRHNSVGFRAPFMHRNPEWMQTLNIEYDLSFFDTDPFEPMPGGCMTIWPFTIGHFIELPYTLVQDSTLGYVLGETTPDIWFEKLEFIKKYHGMALINSHPDYLKDPNIWSIYQEFLHKIHDEKKYWHALPREVARWWRIRSDSSTEIESSDITLGTLVVENEKIKIY